MFFYEVFFDYFLQKFSKDVYKITLNVAIMLLLIL